jgi:hypothetical protein
MRIKTQPGRCNKRGAPAQGARVWELVRRVLCFATTGVQNCCSLWRRRQHGLKPPHKPAIHARLARAGSKAGGSQRLTCRTARAALWRRPADQAVLARQACSSYSPVLCLAAPGLVFLKVRRHVRALFGRTRAAGNIPSAAVALASSTHYTQSAEL